MSQARQEILDSIRQYLAASAPFDALRQSHHAPALPTATATIVHPEPVARFRESLTQVGGQFRLVSDETEAAAQVQQILAEKQARRVAVTDAPLIQRVTAAVSDDVTWLENADKTELFGCDAGLTGAQYGIAETGTLVLESHLERHRLVSLVPPFHIAVLTAGQIKETLGEVLSLIEKDLSRTVTFITGPSRTSDIELTLAIGVHGPAELYVIVITGETLDTNVNPT